MEVRKFLNLTPEEKALRKKEFKEREKIFGKGKDPDEEKATLRAHKALILLKSHLQGNIVLSDTQRIAYAGIVVNKSKNDFFFFCKHVLDMDLLSDITHKRWCDDHQKSIKLSKKRVMRLKSRGTFKTTVYGIGAILWLWGCFSPQIRIFYTSANALLLQEVSDKLNQYIGSEKNETLFSLIFGITKDVGAKNTSDVMNIKGRSGKGFSLILRTSGGSSVGIHPNVIIVDDPLDHNDRDSETTRIGKEAWFDSLVPLLVPFKDEVNDIVFESIYYIGTRWHFKDLVNHILERNEKLPAEKKWDVEIESICDDKFKSNYPDFISDEQILEIKSGISDLFFSCNTGEAPVLMSDFTTKRIDEMKAGDKIIGFTIADGMQNKSKLVVTEVLDTKHRLADVVKITLESGRVIRCTPDHKWYNGRSGRDSHSAYTPAKIGRNLLRVVDCHYEPTYDELLDWRYLGGLLDGEGSCKHGQLSLHQSKSKNPEVYKKIEETFKRLNISYNVYEHKGKDACHQFHIRGGRDIRAHILRYANIAKKNQILDYIINKRNRTVTTDKTKYRKDHDPQIVTYGGRDKIINIEPDGREEVYSMQTTTGNYVVWGYASKNCQYMNSPLMDGLQIFDLKKLTLVRPEQVQFELGQINCFFDPSLGKASSDYPMCLWLHFHEDTITVIDAIDEKVELSLLVHQIAAKNREYQCRSLTFENNGLTLIEQSLRDAHQRIGYRIYLDPVHHYGNKHERICSIQPDLYSGRVRFLDDYLTRYPEFMNQLIFYGAYGNDDGPDCLEMGISYFRKPRFTFKRYESCL